MTPDGEDLTFFSFFVLGVVQQGKLVLPLQA